MQNPIITIFVFVTILFFYIHVTSQWKTSDDLEIYETDFESPAHLQEVCSVKQPVLLKLAKHPAASPFFERFQAAQFEKYDNIDIRLKDRSDYADANGSSVEYVPVTFRSARRLMSTDTNAKYFSENNHAFLEESGLDRLSAMLDPLLKPPLSAHTKYDILLGSPLATTPLRYHLESHRFLAVTRGKIRVKLCPPKYSKILSVTKDYEGYEFYSTFNPWLAADNQPQKDVAQKLKFLDVEVNSGDVLFLPMYWWYSISFSGDPETTAATFGYDVAMNILAQAKHWGLYYLQQSNIKTRPAKTLSTEKTLSTSLSLSDQKDTGIDETTRVDTTVETSQNKEIVTNAGIYVTNNIQ